MHGQGGFRDDFFASIRAWRRAPGLPLLTLALVLLGYVLGRLATDESALLGIPLVPLAVFGVGFVGTQRIWYLRLFRNDRLDASELGPLTWAFIGRFLALWLVASAIGSVVSAAIFGLALLGLPSPARSVVEIGFLIAIDVLLTFATPALTYSVRSVFDAVRMGRLVLQRCWREIAWYALAPGLTWFAAASLAWPLGDGAVLGILLLGSACSLACKGAAARWYLRAYPDTERNGAAFEDAPRFEAARRNREERIAR